MISDCRERVNKEEVKTERPLGKVAGKGHRAKVSIFILDKKVQKIRSCKDELRAGAKGIAVRSMPD